MKQASTTPNMLTAIITAAQATAARVRARSNSRARTGDRVRASM
ncbi:MAG: hypothetical protein SGI92_30295 [Bryobacteraceae bacterium]|nr:hypothetical protein [Bryobacteraceae bacterium]